ncbi:hypothetical protein MNKW57_13920 [Biformimicrobium ophioploci]|uniref:Uncharacterized protein n=1 Tax=Biformimicrobium ophioploci TaxID=3036711 RepID=A0ABQ6LY92_9GAMM|nr:hypothetical protein MNKW57_13920 [Microbulbifer sp. NKW57]
MATGEQVVKEVYGQPVIFSEGRHLLALSTDEIIYDAEAEALFLRFWAFNGGTEDLLLDRADVRGFLHNANERVSIPLMSQDEVNLWREAKTTRKILSVTYYTNHTPVSSPLYFDTALQDVAYANRGGVGGMLLQSNELGSGARAINGENGAQSTSGILHYYKYFPEYYVGSPGGDNPFNKTFRKITYRKTVPAPRMIFGDRMIPAGEVQGGFIALDMRNASRKDPAILTLQVKLGGEQHLFNIRQDRIPRDEVAALLE